MKGQLSRKWFPLRSGESLGSLRRGGYAFNACLNSRVGQSLGDWEKERSFTKAWSCQVSRHSFICHLGQAAQPAVSEIKNGNGRSVLGLGISEQGGDLESYLSLMGRVVLCSELFPRTQKGEGFLHCHCLPGVRGSGKAQCSQYHGAKHPAF